jgi:type IV pilus assembly protein PilV
VRHTRRRTEQGFTLVEALVALVVLSVGLLGIAGLQLIGMKANKGSATRTQAVYLAYDIIDRMRANSLDALKGNYNLALTATPAGGTMAGDDLVGWRSNITRVLPPGSVTPTGSVAYDTTTNIITVDVEWDDSHANVSNDAHPNGTVFTPNPNGDVVHFTMTTQLFN